MENDPRHLEVVRNESKNQEHNEIGSLNELLVIGSSNETLPQCKTPVSVETRKKTFGIKSSIIRSVRRLRQRISKLILRKS